MIIIIIIIKHGGNKNNHVSIQHINLYELLEGHGLPYQMHININNCFQDLIKVLGRESNHWLLEIKESLFIKRDKLSLNKNIYSQELLLF